MSTPWLLKQVCIALAFSLLSMILQTATWAQQAVVLESNVKSFPAGTLLEATKVLRLAKSDTVLVIAENGTMTTIRGPHQGTWLLQQKAPADSANVKAALGRLLAARSEDTSTLGTVRRLSGSTAWLQAHARQGWNLVSAEHDGVQCILPNQPVRLLRKNPGQAESARLRQTDSSYQPLHWVQNASFVDWPATVPLQHGGIYLLRRVGSSIPYRVQIKEMAPEFTQTAPAYQMALLLSNHCTVQATLLQYAANL